MTLAWRRARGRYYNGDIFCRSLLRSGQHLQDCHHTVGVGSAQKDEWIKLNPSLSQNNLRSILDSKMSSTEKGDGPKGQRVKDASNPGPETRSRRKDDDACTSRRRSTRAVTHLVQKEKQGESSSPFSGCTDPQRLPSSWLLLETSTPDRWGGILGIRFPCDSHRE